MLEEAQEQFVMNWRSFRDNSYQHEIKADEVLVNGSAFIGNIKSKTTSKELEGLVENLLSGDIDQFTIESEMADTVYMSFRRSN